MTRVEIVIFRSLGSWRRPPYNAHPNREPTHAQPHITHAPPADRRRPADRGRLSGDSFASLASDRVTPSHWLVLASGSTRCVDVSVYAGLDGAAVEAHVARGARGVVMAAVGAGGLTPDQREAIERAQRRGVVVVTASRTGSGVVRSTPPGGVAGDDLLPQKARILLMLALTRTRDVSQIQQWFDQF